MEQQNGQWVFYMGLQGLNVGAYTTRKKVLGKVAMSLSGAGKELRTCASFYNAKP